jgi:UDP-glucose 4-epimerase
VREGIAAAERVTGRRIARREMARRAGDPPVLVADVARARAALGWQARMSGLDGILGTAWAWHNRPGAVRAVGD